jgi:phosphate-selective porin OprO/OprP
MSYQKFLLGSVAVCGALSLTAPAHAQSAAISGQIQALQDQVRALTQQLQTLQGQVIQTQQNQTQTQHSVDQIKTQPQSSPSGIVVSMPNNRPTLSTADEQNSIALTGRLQFDAGDYLDYNAASHKVAPNNLNSGVNLRRGRIGVLGKVMGDWNYALIYDFGGSNDSGAGGINAGGIQTAEVTYNGLRPFAIELGYGDTPYTLDEATSSNDIMFVERASSQVIATNIAAGDFRSNVGAHWNNDRAWIGVYGTGPQSGANHAIGQQTGAFGRATYQVLQSDKYSFHIGADASGLIKPPTTGGVRAITLSDRPELRIDTTQILSTGQIGTVANPVSGASVVGAELAGGFGPFFSQAEYFHYNIERTGAPKLDFDGGYVEGSYTITGEHRKYNPSTGAYGGITPEHPFSLSAGQWGAFEIAARYSIVDLNDLFTPGLSTASTNGVAGGQQQVIALGVNWYLNSNMRFMVDYLHGLIGKDSGSAATAPLGTAIGGNFDAIALRTQVAW